MERPVWGCQDYQQVYTGRRGLQDLKFQEGKVTLILGRWIPQAFHQLETRHFSWVSSKTNDERNGRSLSQNQDQKTLRYHQRLQVSWIGQENFASFQKAWIWMGRNPIFGTFDHEKTIMRRKHRSEWVEQRWRCPKPWGKDQFAAHYQKQCVQSIYLPASPKIMRRKI